MALLELTHFGKLNNGVVLPSEVLGTYNTRPFGKNILWTAQGDAWVEFLPGWKQFPKWHLQVDSSQRVMTLDSAKDVLEAIHQFPLRITNDLYGFAPGSSFVREPLIDWRKVAQDFDGVYLTEQGIEQVETNGNRYNAFHLRDWDLASFVIFHPRIVQSVQRVA